MKAHTTLESNYRQSLKINSIEAKWISYAGAFLREHIFTDTGLQETFYAPPNAVIQRLTGKSIQRAVKGHFMIDTALHALLMSELYNRPLHSPVSEQATGPYGEKYSGSTVESESSFFTA